MAESWAGGRAFVVARKGRNGPGAKGRREVDDVREGPEEAQPAAVSETTKQAGEGRSRWLWTEPTVWTERMLTALEQGVKGGKWYSLMDKVWHLPNLSAAAAEVVANDGAAGMDCQTVEMFERHLGANLRKLSQELREGSYAPQEVKRVWIPKPGTQEKRPLGIPTVRDRVVQAALRHVLEPIFEREFAEHSYGFRPQRGAKDALRRVDALLQNGYHWVVDADLKSYFDTIPHGALLEQVGAKVADGRVLNLVGQFLKQKVMDTAQSWTPEEGTPQGGVISPLLSNIYLNPLDHRMQAAGTEMVRYADDFVILCRSEAEARQALEKVRQWTAEAGLRLHPDKTRIVDVRQPGGFDFLGYHFEQGKKWPREKSLRKLNETIRVKTPRNSGHSLACMIADVNRTLKGWFEYFKHSHQWTFARIDKRVRSRLRNILRNRTGRSGVAGGVDHQRWPNAFFAQHGLFSLAAAHAVARQSSRR